MIITKQKSKDDILGMLKNHTKIFLIGCGECATTCKTGGEEQLKAMKAYLEEHGKIVSGYVVPKAPCVAPQIKIAFAQNRKAIKESDAILTFACGLGIQSVKENDRENLEVYPGNDTLFGAMMDSLGNFHERCSACGECVLHITGGICPVTRCPKGLLNGPCGGMNKGKCEVDKNQDCIWVLIYKELEKRNKQGQFNKINPPKDFAKTHKPHKLLLGEY